METPTGARLLLDTDESLAKLGPHTTPAPKKPALCGQQGHQGPRERAWPRGQGTPPPPLRQRLCKHSGPTSSSCVPSPSPQVPPPVPPGWASQAGNQSLWCMGVGALFRTAPTPRGRWVQYEPSVRWDLRSNVRMASPSSHEGMACQEFLPPYYGSGSTMASRPC